MRLNFEKYFDSIIGDLNVIIKQNKYPHSKQFLWDRTVHYKQD